MYGVADVERTLSDLSERREHIKSQISALQDELFDVENEIEFQTQELDHLIEREEWEEGEFYRLMREEEDGNT